MSIARIYHGFLPYQTIPQFRDMGMTALDPRNRASCGIFSLHHAMVFLGQGTRFQWLREDHPALLDKLHFGTISKSLCALARRQKLRPTVHSSWLKTAPIRKKLDRALGTGHPVIVGSEPHCHWICIGGRTEDGGYVWADSADRPAIGAFGSWEELEHWMLHSSDPEYPSFPDLESDLEIIEIAPGGQMPSSRSMVPWIGGIWESLASDQAYAKDWSNLLADMLDVFWDLDYAPKALPAGDFLDEHLEAIIDTVAWQKKLPKASVRDTAHAYRDAADFHSLAVPSGEEAGVLSSFALKLAAKADR